MKPKGFSRGPGPPNGARVEWIVAQSARPFLSESARRLFNHVAAGAVNFNAAAFRPNGASADRPACLAIGRADLSPSFAACRSRNGQSTAPGASVGLFRRGCRSLRRCEQFDNRPAPLISSPKRCGQSAVVTEVETEVGSSVGWRSGGSRVGARRFDGSSGSPQRPCQCEIENMRHYYCVSALILLV